MRNAITLLFFLFCISLGSYARGQSHWSVSALAGTSTAHSPSDSRLRGTFLLAPSAGISGGYTLPFGESAWYGRVEVGGVYHHLAYQDISGPPNVELSDYLLLLTASAHVYRALGVKSAWNVYLGLQPEIMVDEAEPFVVIDIPYHLMGNVGLGYRINEHWGLSAEAQTGLTDIVDGYEEGVPEEVYSSLALYLRRYGLRVRYHF